jgi:hypothetical protein
MSRRVLETTDIEVERLRRPPRPSPVLLQLWEDAQRLVSARLSPSLPPARSTEPAERTRKVSYSHD